VIANAHGYRGRGGGGSDVGERVSRQEEQQMVAVLKGALRVGHAPGCRLESIDRQVEQVRHAALADEEEVRHVAEHRSGHLRGPGGFGEL
jgi:hypothetical protein